MLAHDLVAGPLVGPKYAARLVGRRIDDSLAGTYISFRGGTSRTVSEKDFRDRARDAPRLRRGPDRMGGPLDHASTMTVTDDGFSRSRRDARSRPGTPRHMPGRS